MNVWCAFMEANRKTNTSVVKQVLLQTTPNWHRARGSPLAPATPPDMRVRIRRFSSVERKCFKQSCTTERVELGNRKDVWQSRTVHQTPRAMGTAGGLSCKVSADVPLAQFRKTAPSRAPIASRSWLATSGESPSPRLPGGGLRLIYDLRPETPYRAGGEWAFTPILRGRCQARSDLAFDQAACPPL